jgi:diazepam-binding inhibitor (GABA receptor modulating acyl-CoA-binding protein)
MSDAAAKFEDAQARVKKLAKSPSNDDLLELYALYKQATTGDVSGSRPGMLDMKVAPSSTPGPRRRARARTTR